MGGHVAFYVGWIHIALLTRLSHPWGCWVRFLRTDIPCTVFIHPLRTHNTKPESEKRNIRDPNIPIPYVRCIHLVAPKPATLASELGQLQQGLLERGERLAQVEEKTGQLRDASRQFVENVRELQRDRKWYHF
jgi:hypothetical protein